MIIMKKNLPRGLRKHIRKEKGRIRREVFDLNQQEKLIKELYPVKNPVPAGKDKN